MKLPRERFDYSAIVDRPPLRLPRGVRVAVWTIVNVEEWDIQGPMPRTVLPPPGGGSAVPDVPNWAWHDYGMRVGFWRLKVALDRYRIKATLAINAAVCHSYPRVAEAARDASWEFMGHSHLQQPLHAVDDQREVIRKSVEILRKFTGRPPRGWLGPGLTETWETLDLLAEAGLEYVCDWVNPDLVLMDEPTEGLAPLLVREVGRVIADLKARGLSILLVEQNIPLALRVTGRPLAGPDRALVRAARAVGERGGQVPLPRAVGPRRSERRCEPAFGPGSTGTPRRAGTRVRTAAAEKSTAGVPRGPGVDYARR